MSDEQKKVETIDERIARIKKEQEAKPKEEPKVAKAAEEPAKEQPAKPAAFNLEELEAKLSKVESYQLTFEGKAGYNPYLWLATFFTPLKKRLNEGERSEELKNLILMLPDDEAPDIKKFAKRAFKLSEVLNDRGQIHLPKK